jgi:hypothetical protein
MAGKKSHKDMLSKRELAGNSSPTGRITSPTNQELAELIWKNNHNVSKSWKVYCDLQPDGNKPGKTTFQNWAANPEVTSLIREMNEGAVISALTLFSNEAENAAQRIVDLSKTGDHTMRVQLDAAKMILDYAHTNINLQKLMQQVEELQAIVEEQSSK